MRSSIIIASHREGDRLWKTVESCVETCLGLDHEIVVADDASDDGSVEELVRRFPQVRVHRHATRQGASPAKALGAQHARGDVLVFLDGHCKPEHGAIARLIKNVESVDPQAVFTPAVAALDDARWQNNRGQCGHGYYLNLEDFSCGWLNLNQLREVEVGRRRVYESPSLIGCALAVGRELYDKLWGFDAAMRFWGVEDLDFGLKCWLFGSRVLHDPEAVVGHRFRGSFDNYTVPIEHVVANQLRMARKHFTLATWSEWVDRCRARHPHRATEHPEGLWALAWEVFQANRANVEHERAYFLGRRARDEFWYAERFGLEWPKLGTTTTVPASPEFFAEPSPSPSAPPPRRLVLLFGYWPPTDIGVPGNRTFPQPPFPNATEFGQGMLWKWQTLQPNYLGSGYDVLAITPTFKSVLGYNTYQYPPNTGPMIIDPFWGTGSGTLMVDYHATSTDFWNIVAKYRPIAIMSFSRGYPDNSWELEDFGTNWSNDQWAIQLPYLNFDGSQHVPPATWQPPFIGGGPLDPAPPSKGVQPPDGDPPDPTRIAAFDSTDPADAPPASKRHSNLPMTAIADAVNARFPDGEIEARVDTTGGSGNFVSNFMAYHVVWYREWWTGVNDDQDLACLVSGHTHVGMFVAAKDATVAVDIQLRELFMVLGNP